MAVLDGLPPPRDFIDRVNVLVDVAESAVPAPSVLPTRLDRICTIALNELQQAMQYDGLGYSKSREAFVHFYKFSMLFTANVAKHPDYGASPAAQALHAKVSAALARMEAIKAAWLAAFLDEIAEQDLLDEECRANEAVPLAPPATVPGQSAAPAPLPSAPAAAIEAAKRPVSDGEWEAALKLLSGPAASASTEASVPPAPKAAASSAGAAPEPAGHPFAAAAVPSSPARAKGVTVSGSCGARGPGVGDPNDGTMGWCRGFEGGGGVTTLMCGGLLKNVLGWPTSDLGRLRHLYVPTGIVRRFVEMAAANSALPPRGVETCGILAGRITPDGDVSMTTLVVPQQKGDADSCELTERGEMQVFEVCSGSGLVQLGWIHTHPSQECFLSSYDVRTHLGFQTMLPEAVAIVAAPRDRRLTYGVFRLIEPEGVEIVRSRPTNQHYLVPDGVFIYETTSHVRMVGGRQAGPRGAPGGAGPGGTPLDADDFEVLDLRDGR